MVVDTERLDADAPTLARRLTRWTRSHRLIASGMAIAVAALAVFVGVKATAERSSSRERFPGTVEEPASWRQGPSMSEYNASGSFWRTTYVTYVIEMRRAEGYSTGRCIGVDGFVSVKKADPAELAAAPLAVEFAAGGVIVTKGDADAACHASAVRRALLDAGDNGLPLDEAQLNHLINTAHHFFEIVYIPDDAGVDSIVVTTQPAVAGEAIPPRSSIYAFEVAESENPWDPLNPSGAVTPSSTPSSPTS